MAKSHTELPVTAWNVRHFHEYLAHLNADRTGVTYQPFGKGAVGQRWRTEQGQLKTAIATYGAPTIKRYIDICFASASYNPRFPVLSWGFMWAYMRAELARAEVEGATEQAVEAPAEDDSWRDFL